VAILELVIAGGERRASRRARQSLKALPPARRFPAGFYYYYYYWDFIVIIIGCGFWFDPTKKLVVSKMSNRLIKMGVADDWRCVCYGFRFEKHERSSFSWEMVPGQIRIVLWNYLLKYFRFNEDKKEVNESIETPILLFIGCNKNTCNISNRYTSETF
jgi:hypothetical protein